jgi:hypothetical protein
MAKIIQIVIEAVTYTPDLEPVHIHYTGVQGTTGPLAKHHIHYTSQSALSARSGKGEGYWSCEEVKASLKEHLEAIGMSVELVDRRPKAGVKKPVIPAKFKPAVDL